MPNETNGTIKIGEREIASLMVGRMGIKSIFIGDKKVYERPGGYVYICLDTKSDYSNT